MRILLAHDGSPDANRAADLARDLAWPPNSVLRVIGVIEPTMIALTGFAGGAAAYAPDLDQQIHAYQTEQLAAVAQTLSGPNRTVESALFRGRPASVIVDEARTFAADLVLVGSRGRGSITSLVLGSVSGEIVDHAPCPVLVARQSSITRVIVGADGSQSAAAAELLLTSWPIFDGLPITVVSVADVPVPWQTGIAPTMYAQASDAHALDIDQARLEHGRLADESVARLRAAGRDATADLRTGDAASEIIAAVGDHHADLVVLGSRGRTGLTRLLLGSVARNVVHSSSASVLVVRDAATV